MTASALLGNELRFQYLNTAVSPNAYASFAAAFDFGDFGEEKPLVDISVLESTAREYRNGLADGVEIPLQSNFTANNAQWLVFKTAYDNDTLMTFRIIVPTASPSFGFQFTATVRSWTISGTPGEKSIARFGLKISGSVSVI
jgi:hypothetical protein